MAGSMKTAVVSSLRSAAKSFMSTTYFSLTFRWTDVLLLLVFSVKVCIQIVGLANMPWIPPAWLTGGESGYGVAWVADKGSYSNLC